jgi:hypothetical protein
MKCGKERLAERWVKEEYEVKMPGVPWVKAMMNRVMSCLR